MRPLPDEAAAALVSHLAEGNGADRIQLAEIMSALGERGPAALALILALPNALPMPPGTSAVLGLPLLFVVVQMMLGRPAWLPAALARRSLPRKVLAPALRCAAGLLGKPVRWPRLGWVATSRPASGAIGAICVALAGVLFLPIPFGNIPPALAISLFALAQLRRDALCAAAGLAMTLLSIAFLWGGWQLASLALLEWTARL
jgi:hypothetical protein